MDVINQTWSPMYELKNVFDVFLPQLLMYPNPSDPLNGEAAHLMMTNKDKFDETVSKKLLKFLRLLILKLSNRSRNTSKSMAHSSTSVALLMEMVLKRIMKENKMGKINLMLVVNSAKHLTLNIMMPILMATWSRTMKRKKI